MAKLFSTVLLVKFGVEKTSHSRRFFLRPPYHNGSRGSHPARSAKESGISEILSRFPSLANSIGADH